jgi:hypothetical protein
MLSKLAQLPYFNPATACHKASPNLLLGPGKVRNSKLLAMLYLKHSGFVVYAQTFKEKARFPKVSARKNATMPDWVRCSDKVPDTFAQNSHSRS